VRFHIPGGLREFAQGRSQVEIEHPAATLNQALLVLWTLCPGMRDRVVTEQGEVRPHVNIFVDDENIRYSGGLATPVTAESVISIVPAVSGGGESKSSSPPTECERGICNLQAGSV
jgi:sulfur-carrier protein